MIFMRNGILGAVAAVAILAMGPSAPSHPPVVRTPLASSGMLIPRADTVLACADTLTPRYSILTDTVLKVAGFNIVSRPFGASRIFFRVWSCGKPIMGDTVNFSRDATGITLVNQVKIVAGVPPLPITVVVHDTVPIAAGAVHDTVVRHDTTWTYLQTNPTNPFAGGDSTAGLVYIKRWGLDAIYWHGHFMGAAWQVVKPDSSGTLVWEAAFYDPKTFEGCAGQCEMLVPMGYPNNIVFFAAESTAILALQPFTLALSGVRNPPPGSPQ